MVERTLTIGLPWKRYLLNGCVVSLLWCLLRLLAARYRSPTFCCVRGMASAEALRAACSSPLSGGRITRSAPFRLRIVGRLRQTPSMPSWWHKELSMDQVQRFAFRARPVQIDQNDLAGDPVNRKGVGKRRSDRSGADDDHFSGSRVHHDRDSGSISKRCSASARPVTIPLGATHIPGRPRRRRVGAHRDARRR